MAKRQKKQFKKMTPAEKAQAGLDHFEREKRAYEERTGEKVLYVPPTPIALMPESEVVSDEGKGPSNDSEDAAGPNDEAADETAEGESEQ